MVELFACVDGYDLEAAAPLLVNEFTCFVTENSWSADVWVVNDREDLDPQGAASDLPEWNLGLSLVADHVTDDYWQDVERILSFLKRLRGQTGRDFVVGVNGEDRISIDDSPLTKQRFGRCWSLERPRRGRSPRASQEEVEPSPPHSRCGGSFSA